MKVIQFRYNTKYTPTSYEWYNLRAHHYRQQIVSSMPQNGHFNNIYYAIILLNNFYVVFVQFPLACTEMKNVFYKITFILIYPSLKSIC